MLWKHVKKVVAIPEVDKCQIGCKKKQNNKEYTEK